ncbi:MAG: type II toxin-antitoxin system prevent-host-death family antitoxin, partial [Actinobacteria bacterium]|nr:type II toxin-antitoxin system prevent-host-death family antitoxin [Actinomycetota bacterium]
TTKEQAMEFVNTRTAKAKLSHYLNNLESTGPVIITSNGVPKGILTTFSEDDIDEFVIRHSEKIHKMVMEGLGDIRQGRTYTVDEAFARADDMEKEIDED